MSELPKTVAHYRSRLSLWWSGVMRAHHEQQARTRAPHQRQLGEGGIPQGWFQHPNDPPGYQRWWDGTRWAEHTRQIAVKKGGEFNGAVFMGWIVFLCGLAFWPFFLVSFVLGAIVVAQGRAGTGVVLMLLSVIGPIISLAGCAALVADGS